MSQDPVPLRTILTASDLKLPDCPIPRPDEAVVWFTEAFKRTGIYVGYGPEAKPIVLADDGVTITLEAFDELRLVDPFSRRAPTWSHLEPGRILKPHPQESAKFQALLRRRIPPGPSYLELIEEIWNRGFEVFLVGGTVRDVIGGGDPHDIDLVSSIPLRRAVPFLTRMFRAQPSIDEQNGYVRLGGPTKDGAPFVDLKSFVYREPGSAYAVFAGDFARDIKFRDFACNAIYYDPINDALLDPSRVGVRAAEIKELNLVCDPTVRSAYFRAEIVIRFAKFRAQG